MGVPLSFESRKGYSILQGFFLSPITLTSEEANALILITALSGRFADKITQDYIENAVTKIKAVLRMTEKIKADFLQSQIKIYPVKTETYPSNFLTEIQNSITNKQVIIINYTNNDAQKSQREIEPIGLTFYSNQWHVIAWCWKRKSYRDFKIGQINHLKNSGETFRKKNHYSLNEYIQSLH